VTEPATDAKPGLSTESRFEIVATILLAIAALATAWSGYQSALWGGIQSSSYTQASAARVTANQRLTAGNQLRLADLGLLQAYLDARAQDLDDLAEFYEVRFRDEFKVAFEAWEELDPYNDPTAPPNPFVMPEYQLATEQESASLVTSAEAKFAEGEQANKNSDNFTLSTVMFAAVLFFAAISDRVQHSPSRIATLAFATAGLLGGMAIALSQPVTSG
jgi:hypothetical protein